MADTNTGAKEYKIPNNLQQSFGTGILEKGRWGQSVYLLLWDFVQKCNYTECPLYDICQYRKSHMMDPKNPMCTDKCVLHLRYLKNVVSAVMEKVENKGEMKHEHVLKMGYSMLPLYTQLFKFKMWEYSNQDIMMKTKDGVKVHPIYKEIRDTIKTINSMWKEVVGQSKRGPDPSKMGDAAFIDAMYSVEEGGHNSSDGSGIDFDGSDESNTDSSSESDGSGIDFQAAGVPDEPPKKKPVYKKKKKKKDRKYKSRKKPKPEVLPFNSPRKKALEKAQKEAEENAKNETNNE